MEFCLTVLRPCSIADVLSRTNIVGTSFCFIFCLQVTDLVGLGYKAVYCESCPSLLIVLAMVFLLSGTCRCLQTLCWKKLAVCYLAGGV